MSADNNNAPDYAGRSGEHTPGPWLPVRINSTTINVVPDRVHGFKVQILGGDDARMVAHVFGKTAVEAEANARLIAAAPELLAALHEITREYRRELGNDHQRGAWDRARAAIAKAEGRQS